MKAVESNKPNNNGKDDTCRIGSETHECIIRGTWEGHQRLMSKEFYSGRQDSVHVLLDYLSFQRLLASVVYISVAGHAMSELDSNDAVNNRNLQY